MVKTLLHTADTGFDTGLDLADQTPAATTFDGVAAPEIDTNGGFVVTTSGAAATPTDTSGATVGLSGPIVTTSAGTSPFVINPIFDASILNAGSVLMGQLETAINTAIQALESIITTNETMSIHFGYGTIGGTTTTVSALGQSSYSINVYNYTQVRNALISHAATVAALSGVAASLPSTDPTGGGQIYLTLAEAHALGLASGTNVGTVGGVGISDTISLGFTAAGTSVVGGGAWAVGVFEHEISEVLGRVQALGTAFGTGNYTPLDFFRYSSAGSMELTQGGTSAYFSVNGGTTNLGAFNLLLSNGDLADWASSVVHDSFDNSETIGIVNTISATDITAMSALGYTLACFAAGTRILTARGQVAVEDLAVGDIVTAGFAGKAPITWIGHRHIDCRRHPNPETVWPIRVSAGAFGEGLPRRDLFLSPDHAVPVDGMLIPIKRLVNHASITRHPVDQVTWYHVELPAHDLLFAEGLAAESYLDTGNRGNFANGGSAIAMHADFATIPADHRREQGSCLPFATADAVIEPVWHQLSALAEAQGFRRAAAAPLTTDPAPVLEVDGRILRPIAHDQDRVTFALPAGTTMATLRTRAASPSLAAPWRDDPRVLGVAVSRLVLRDAHGTTVIPADHPALCDGWSMVEADGPRLWRWTDGAALLPALGRDGPTLLEVHLAATLAYPLDTPVQAVTDVRHAA